MAAATKTASTKVFLSNEPIIERFTHPDVPAGQNSGEIVLPLAQGRGQLWGVRAACASLNFDFVLYCKSDPSVGGAGIPSIDEIYRKAGNNLLLNEFGIVPGNPLFFVNRDNPESDKLYAFLDNSDSNATGIVTIELIYWKGKDIIT